MTRSKGTTLQRRFIICYSLTIILPLIIISGFFYHSSNEQFQAEKINAHKERMAIEKAHLERYMATNNSYYIQLRSASELENILLGNSYTERQIIYDYQSKIVLQLQNIKHYDENIAGITIYTENDDAARLLPEFKPLEALNDTDIALDRDELQKKLIKGFWHFNKADGGIAYYVGFTNKTYSKLIGVLEISYTHNIFNLFREGEKGLAYILDNGEVIGKIANGDTGNSSMASRQQVDLLAVPKEDTLFDKQNGIVISHFTLEDGVYQMLSLVEIQSTLFAWERYVKGILVIVILFSGASLVMFKLIFSPFRRITNLADHMRQSNKPQLKIYTAKQSSDEIGDLIDAYNQMVEQTNEMSSKLLSKEIQLRNAHIEALQTQLEPHFFYGTLESIRMIAEANNEVLIADIAYAFGKLMRYSLAREYLVQVKDEIHIVEQYLAIQYKRLGNRFAVDWRISTFDAAWLCPKFVLFNMVENVFSHSISQTRQRVQIIITIRKEAEDLILTVADNGPGIEKKRLIAIQDMLKSPDKRKDMTSPNNGRGIFNINDRLKIFYGETYQLELTSIESGGTRCSIRVARQTKASEEGGAYVS